jgi:hypothetical protein
MNKKIILSIVILAAFLPIVLSLEYMPRDCSASTGYCYMDSVDRTAILTNNPRLRNYVMVQPIDALEPVLEPGKTYLEKGGQVIVNPTDYIMEKTLVGGYDKWIYNFSRHVPDLSSGRYTFVATFKWSGSTVETVPYMFTNLIDVDPPIVYDKQLYEDGLLSLDNVAEQDTRLVIKVTVGDDEGIADTVTAGVNISVDGGARNAMTQELLGIYSYEMNLTLGDHTIIFYPYDNLTNIGSDIYSISVKDTMGPRMDVIWPLFNYSITRTTDINVSTNEPGSCNLYRMGDTTPINSIPTTLGGYHVFKNVLLDDIQFGDEQITLFNVSCTDQYNNYNSRIFSITYTTRWPMITDISSTRGDYITSFENGKITSLSLTTNMETECRYVGGLKGSVTEPTETDYNTITKVDDLFLTLHEKDLTQEIQAIPDYSLNKEYIYYVLCKDLLPPFRISPLAFINFTVNIQFEITGTAPNDMIRYNDVVLFVNTSRMAMCEYKTGTQPWKTFDNEALPDKYYHYGSLGVISDGIYNYDVRCTTTSFSDPGSIITGTMHFIVNTRPDPMPPVIWPLPIQTDQSMINVIGYAGMNDLTVNIGSAELLMDPTYTNSQYITYDSHLLGTYMVLGQSGNELTVNDEAYSAINIGDYLWFDTCDLPYFARYQVIDKQIGWMDAKKIVVSPSLSQQIVGKEIFIYDTMYPAGWFNISVQLIPETMNYILAFSEDYLGLKGPQATAGPVFFHIDAPVLDLLPVIVKSSQLTVSGTAKASNAVKVYRNTTSGQASSVQTNTNGQGNFSTVITLVPGENFIYAVVVDGAGNPISAESLKLSVIYDNEVPVFEEHSPTGSDLERNNVELIVYARDNVMLDILSLRMQVDGEGVPPLFEEQGGRLKIFYLTSFITRDHTILVSINDTAGNTGSHSWSFSTFIPPQCVDGIDNDNDGLIDYMLDPGCDGQSDDNESNPPCGPSMPQCWDCIDNDNDGFIDYMFDLDCDTIYDDLEETVIVPVCGDLIRNQLSEDCDGPDLRGFSCEDLGCKTPIFGDLLCTPQCTFDTSYCVECGTQYCGNGIRDGSEECDGNDLGGMQCGNFDDYTGGSLSCNSACELDFSGCTGPHPPICGDNLINQIDELCDGSDLGGVTCIDLGFLSGKLGCQADCNGYILNDCSYSTYCGDGVMNGLEECDGSDFGAVTCGFFGFIGGNLQCTPSCKIDLTACGVEPTCGDGVANQLIEECDTFDLNGMNCQMLGYTGGSLLCDGSCSYDTSGCVGPGLHICGDGNVDKPNSGGIYEECDGINLDSKSCQFFDDYTGGTLACRGDCQFDLSGCVGPTSPYCGDDAVNKLGEDCDGIDLDGKTCQSFGYTGGTLVCNGLCEFVTTGCSGPQPPGTCGDNKVDKPNAGAFYEECDGTALDGKQCTDFPAYSGGNLACTSGCEFDFAGCIISTPKECGDGVRNQLSEDCDGIDLHWETCLDFGCNGGILGCDSNCEFVIDQCTDCGAQFCGNGAKDGFEECDGSDLGGMQCNNFDDYTSGTLGCTSDCQLDFSLCSGPHPPLCGDNVINKFDEICDGADLGGMTCQELGYISGNLACANECKGYILTGCRSDFICGDGVLNRVEEECDGSDLGGFSCELLGFDTGTLSCKADCVLDRTGCASEPECGDNVVNQMTEECDGTDLDQNTCESLGYMSGTLLCAPDCKLDKTLCVIDPTKPVCGDGIIDKPNYAGFYEECDGVALDNKQCTDFDDYDTGILQCSSTCEFDYNLCINLPPPICGDNIKNQMTEDCDGLDLNGLNCNDFGCDSGVLECSQSCDFVTTGCFDCGAEFCGNNKVDRMEEECDGLDLQSKQCSDFGFYTGGSLGCTTDCQFDFNACTGPPTVCGDGVINDVDEVCDGTDLGGHSCQSEGFLSGDLKCNPTCNAFDYRECNLNPICGDGALNRIEEECDGNDFGGMTCELLMLGSGQLSCRGDCMLDTTNCGSLAVCGDGVRNQLTEDCDGYDLDGKTCQTFGYQGGQLSCNSLCDFDKSSCSNPMPDICGDNKVDKPNSGGMYEECDGPSLDGMACTDFDGYTSGVLLCGSGCTFDYTLCVGSEPANCGDNLRNQITEDCDGIDLDGKTCQTFGFLGGSLNCNSFCEFDTSLCTNPQPDICGDGNVDKPNNGGIFEECDGLNLDGLSCSSFPAYNGGLLSCTSFCEFDFSECTLTVPAECGDNNVNQITEDCDGIDLEGKSCMDFGCNFGTLACDANCDFSLSNCLDCGGMYCGDGSINRPEEECDKTDLGGMQCSDFDDYTGGSLACTSDCQFDFNLCTGPNPPKCGDGVINQFWEICDGGDLGGATCQSEGFASGSLGCSPSCDSYVYTNCFSQAYCGDGAINRVEEECDGSDLGILEEA